VHGEVDAAPLGGDRDPVEALDDVALQPVLRQAHEGLGGQPDVAHGGHREQTHEVRLELFPRHVCHVAAADHHVPDAGVGLEVGEVGVVAVHRLEGQLELVDLRGAVADQVHPGAVPAVLRAGGEQLGEHLGGVAVGEALGDPHVVLVQGVAGGVRV
jgi:hypothetical protein